MAAIALPVPHRTGFLTALVRRIRVVAESPEMVSIRRALPVSFIGLAIGLAGFMAAASGTFLHRFQTSFAAAFGLMSALLVVLLAADLAPRRGVPRVLAVAVAGVVFALSLPYEHQRSLWSVATAVGSSGLFLAIGIALVTVALMALGRAVFGVVMGSVAAAFVAIGIAGALQFSGISLTSTLDLAIAPLGHLGDSLGALLVIVLIETLLWTIGIHGPALLAAVVLPVYINLQLANTQALAHGRPLPHIVTISLFLFVFPGGAGGTLPLVLLLMRSKVGRLRRIALATLVPTLVNANEPLMFGLPLVLNPTLAVPFVLVPLTLAVVTYEAVKLGFVARPAYYIPSTIPLPLGAFFATRDWRAVVLMLVNIALGVALYAPFARAFERQERAREEMAAGNRVRETAA